jgi:hypothetical protein
VPDSLQDTGVLVNPDGTIATLAPRVVELLTGAVTITNLNTEQTLWQTKPLDAAVGHNYEMQLDGEYLHNNVAADTITFRDYRSGTKMLDVTVGLPSLTVGLISAAVQTWWARLRFRMAGPVPLFALWLGGSRPQTTPPTLGVGGQSAGNDPVFVKRSQALPGTNLPVKVTAQWSAASLNNSWQLDHGTLVLY